MRPSSDIIDCISRRIEQCLRQPHSYSPNAIALEEILLILDSVEGYIRGAPQITNCLHNASYAAFLRRNGFDVNTIASQLIENGASEDESISTVVSYWKEYRNERLQEWKSWDAET